MGGMGGMQPGMNMTVTETHQRHGGFEQRHGANSPEEVNKRCMQREQKLTEYKGIIDFLQSQGEDVAEMNRLYEEARLSPEDH